MLTPAGCKERMWKRFPVLRKALEDKKIPSTYFGPTTAHDNMFDAMNRLLHVAVLAREFQERIRETAVMLGPAEMSLDLNHLRKELLDASVYFRESAELVGCLGGNLIDGT